MFRTRAYTRKMRAKHIKRKKNIILHHFGLHDVPYYKHDGMYSKNKVHCSCPLCRGKDINGKHILTKAEKAAILKLAEELQEE